MADAVPEPGTLPTPAAADADRGDPRPPWHALAPEEALTRLGASAEGLDDDAVRERQARFGPNRLATTPPASLTGILLDQLRSVVVLLLVSAAVVALLVGDGLEAAAIAAVLLLNTGIGFVVELRARRAMEALLRYQAPEATVVRGGETSRIPADALVPGDVVDVEEGEAVPADGRILDTVGARAVEAALTGESVPVDKAVAATADPDAPLGDRSSMLFAGTALALGRARMVVVATGMDTELGRIGRLVEGVEEGRTPLERRLDALGRRLVGLTLAIGGLVVVAGLLRRMPLGLVVETGIALAIAAVPEGLPAVATITLAVGLRRMARRQAAIRRLAAVEALGSTTVVCTDKTGTLTAGEMTVTRVVTPSFELDVTGTGYATGGALLRDGEAVTAATSPALRALAEAAALTARARVEEDGAVVGDPTDAGLLVFARKAGIDEEALAQGAPRVGEIPFSSESRLSASFHGEAGAAVAWVKGAPDELLERSSHAMAGDELVPLDAATRAALAEGNDAMAREGLRVIALARGEVPAAGELPVDLTLLGLAGLLDPPAEGVPETVGVFREAGIRTVMITGDQRPTALAVARAVGMPVADGRALDGRDVARLDDAALGREVAATDVFSRVEPEHKLRIVTALQEHGAIVAVLGDGVNDAAALKKADVGVAMGRRGTDVARETADLVLRDDRFPTVGAAVEEGRVIFDNIRKFVFYLFSCNLAEVLVLLGGSAAGLPLPLLPLQILWLNLVTDTFPALALAMEPAEPDIMRRPPRDPEAAILSARFLRALAFYAVLITAATLTAFGWALTSGPPERAVTVSFMTLALAQLFHLGNARSRRPVLRPSRAVANPWAVAAVPGVLALQVLAVHWPPLARVLETVPLTPREWLVVVLLALVPAVVGQAVEAVQAWRGGEPAPKLDEAAGGDVENRRPRS